LLATSDSGRSNSDNITNDATPTFAGSGDANTLLHVTANGAVVSQGSIGTDPSDGIFANGLGSWAATVLALTDGTYQIVAKSEDQAGNVSSSPPLNIFIDTQGPQVTEVFITGHADFDLFDPKPLTNGPTPRADSLTINLRDLPNRVAAFLYDAINQNIADQPGLYVLQGD